MKTKFNKRKNLQNIELSVIMPAFNEINTIAKIIERVRAVKIPKEIIIIDDGSTDGTKEYLTKLKKQNIPKIKIFFHNKNYGKGHAIRIGIKHAEGKIIIIQAMMETLEIRFLMTLIS